MPCGRLVDESRALQHAKVLGHGRPAHREFGREVAHGARPGSEQLHHAAPGGISERVQGEVGGKWVSHHLR